MATPQTGYARTSDGVYLAYQTLGDGPTDIVYQPDWPGNIDMEWEFPSGRTFLEGLANFGRVILHDHRGVGLSSRNVPIPNLETRVADLRVVLAEVGATRPVLTGAVASGSVNALLAASQPDEVSSLVWIDPLPRTAWAADYPWGRTPDDLEAERRDLEVWGTAAYSRAFADDQASIGNIIPEVEAELFAKAGRNACTPDVAIEMQEMWEQTDVRAVLPTIGVPTLIVAIGGDSGQREGMERFEAAAALIPGAEYRVIEGNTWSVPTGAAVVEEIRRFVGVERAVGELDTVLATVLFTDIVRSTESQARMGDNAWKAIIQRHHALVRDALDQWQGVEHDTAGDGFFATFDGPARAIRAAHHIVESVRQLGIEVRAGVHTGECTIVDGKVGGIAVSIGARIAALSEPSQVLVSQTVRDLVAGSRLTFADAGEHTLPGVDGTWRLLAAT
jgi:class 3 adenylate cyclase/pimeloyl-ACP methyl ester carboxylesterase